MTERNACRMPNCSALTRDRGGYASRFCSDNCEIRYDHLQADARDAAQEAAASVYATTRCNGLGRSWAEVAACARCDQQRFTNAYTVINVELELPTQPIAAIDRIPRLATELEAVTFDRV